MGWGERGEGHSDLSQSLSLQPPPRPAAHRLAGSLPQTCPLHPCSIQTGPSTLSNSKPQKMTNVQSTLSPWPRGLSVSGLLHSYGRADTGHPSGPQSQSQHLAAPTEAVPSDTLKLASRPPAPLPAGCDGSQSKSGSQGPCRPSTCPNCTAWPGVTWRPEHAISPKEAPGSRLGFVTKSRAAILESAPSHCCHHMSS